MNTLKISDDTIDLGVGAAILHISAEDDHCDLQNGQAGLFLKNNNGQSTADIQGKFSVNDEPMTAGANDSGGAGFRAFVTPNAGDGLPQLLEITSNDPDDLMNKLNELIQAVNLGRSG